VRHAEEGDADGNSGDMTLAPSVDGVDDRLLDRFAALQPCR